MVAQEILPSSSNARGEHCLQLERAELGAILEALKQNETDDLEIETDSLSSLRAICNLLEKYEDITGMECEMQIS